MRAVRLLVEPFEFISYLKIECKKELNQHGVLRITGLIKEEKGQEYMDAASRETWVKFKVISENNEVRRFFTGILTGLWMKKEGQTYTLTIEVMTGSFLLDIKHHVRSFQDSSLRYTEVVRACIKPIDGSFDMLDKADKAIGKFLLQYKETDWEFMKRLASYMETVLIPEDSLPKPKVYFGYQDITINREVQADSYYMEQDYEGYEKRCAAGDLNLKPADMVNYIVTTREIYGIGETVRFEGRDLVVGKITSWLEGQELYHEYHLHTKKHGFPVTIYNSDIAGVSLKGTVIAVEKTMVKIQIEEDENKTECGACWFDYATVYSTPDGTGWYCMPEIGDEVRLVMPDHVESHAYVASSVHLGSSGNRTNPDNKSWKNKQNKEILFTPDALILRNNKGMMVELSDPEGVKIVSDKDIIVQADGDIQIKSQSAGINMSAGSSILMQQGAAKVRIDNDINISGGKIYMN